MEEELISLVFQNDCLWDKRSKDFKNNQKKQRIWEEIGFSLKISNAEEMFKSLRSKYVREKKMQEKNTRSGAAASTRKEWPWMDNLKFLDDVIAPRRTFSSIKPMEVADDQFMIEAGPSGIQRQQTISESQSVHTESEGCMEDIFSPNSDHNYSSASELFIEETVSPCLIPISSGTKLQRLKQKKRKTETNFQSIDCPQLTDLAAALTAPISFTAPSHSQSSTRWDDGVDIETKLFTQYLAVRLNNLPISERRSFEQKVMKDLTDIENKINTSF